MSFTLWIWKDKLRLWLIELIASAWFCLCLFQICLVNDPRPENPFGHTYTVQHLGNVVGKRVVYVNLPAEDLKKAAAKSISEGKEVGWGWVVLVCLCL